MKKRTCYKCNYFKKRNNKYYCNDLDEYIDPNEPICSDITHEN